MYNIRIIASLLIAFLGVCLSAGNAQLVDHKAFEKRMAKAVEELNNYPHPDTNRVNALLNICSTARFLVEREAIAPYRAEALALSQRLNFTKGMANCYLSYGLYYKSSLKPEIALRYLDSALTVLGNPTEQRLIDLKSAVLERKGTIFFEQDNYYMALDYFFESLKLSNFTMRNSKSNLYISITQVYIKLNNLDKALDYAKQTIAYHETDTGWLQWSVYYPIIDIYLLKNDFEMAMLYLEKIRPHMPHPTEIQLDYGYYHKMGLLNYQQEKYREAFDYFREAYTYALRGGHKMAIGTALRSLSNTALKLDNTEAAKSYALQSLAMAEETHAKAARHDALINLASYYSKVGNTKKAYELLEQATLIKDSLLSESNVKQVNVLAAIYESEKQQKEILVLQNEKEKQAQEVKQKSFLIMIFIASILILLFIGYLGYTNFRKGQQIARDQQEIQHQKIIELEKDKQLLTVDAMLKGQEEERSRIAKDLHDGLGSLLSGTKLSFMNVKENVLLTPETNALFDRSLSMLDNTIGDLRKVAQNLMPEALVKFGLQDALRDFCNSIQSSTDIKVLYQQFGEKRKLGNTAEVFVYRIVQELVTNVIKHADATSIIVQVSMGPDTTDLTVEDNGKGFDMTMLHSKKNGSGMTNIKYRVQYLNGSIDIVTKPGSGTSVNIQLPI